MGIALSLLGPSVSYLEDQLGVSAGVVGILFAVIAASNFFGALVGGRWVTRWGGHVVLRIGVMTFSVGVVFIALASTYVVAAMGAVLIGSATGMTDASMNIMVVWARAGKSGPALNAMHLLFGVGAFLAPLIVDRAIAFTDHLWPVSIVIGLFSFLSIAVLGRRESPFEPEHAPDFHRPELPTKVVVHVAIFFLLYVGGEVGFAGWIHTYAEDQGMSGSNPAFVTAIFWASFALARLVAIPLSKILKPLTIVGGACALSLLGLIIMIVGDVNALSIWIGAALFGFASGPQYPTMIAMVDEKLSLSAQATAWIVGAAAIGGLVVPVSIGALIDTVGSASMPIVVLGVCCLGLAWVFVVQRSISRASELHRTGVLRQV
jgi:FHS family Na+ dependent glucose MFS transporter 1